MPSCLPDHVGVIGSRPDIMATTAARHCPARVAVVGSSASSVVLLIELEQREAKLPLQLVELFPPIDARGHDNLADPFVQVVDGPREIVLALVSREGGGCNQH